MCSCAHMCVHMCILWIIYQKLLFYFFHLSSIKYTVPIFIDLRNYFRGSRNYNNLQTCIFGTQAWEGTTDLSWSLGRRLGLLSLPVIFIYTTWFYIWSFPLISSFTKFSQYKEKWVKGEEKENLMLLIITSKAKPMHLLQMLPIEVEPLPLPVTLLSSYNEFFHFMQMS